MYCPNQNLARKIVAKYGTPVFVTSKQYLESQVSTLKNAAPKNTKVFYAIKANYNPHIVKALKNAGLDGIDAVSPFEIEIAKKCGFTKSQILFTGNNSDDNELQDVLSHSVTQNIGSISELERLGKIQNNINVSIRFNPDIGAGETKQVVTGGSKSKFGINKKELPLVKEITSKYNLNVIGVHCHIGSGFYKTRVFRKAVRAILSIASNFKHLKFVDLGGGFGVRYDIESQSIDIKDFFSSIRSDLENFAKTNGNEFDVIVEPGKFLVAESTCLLTKVTNIKENGGTIFIGTDTGMNHIIRPALYSAHHEIINITSPDAEIKKVTVVGNICESSDILRKKIKMPMPKEGDILAILTAGAYCASMSSLYNLRPYATEVLADHDKVKRIRKRLNFKETLNGLGF